MWVSKKTRYGLRMLVELAINHGNLITLKEISLKENISNKYLEQIVSDLKRVNYVEAERGPKGGYRLIKDPQEITLKDVLDIFDGEGAMVECLNDPLLCERSGHCKSRAIWNEANAKIDNAIRSIKLTELIASYSKTKGQKQ